MSKAITAPADEQTPSSTPSDDQSSHALIEADMLIEEISIDGMCGVY